MRRRVRIGFCRLDLRAIEYPANGVVVRRARVVGRSPRNGWNKHRDDVNTLSNAVANGMTRLG